MGQRGELNVGQLSRERYGRESFLVGLEAVLGELAAYRQAPGASEKLTGRDGPIGQKSTFFPDRFTRAMPIMRRFCTGSDVLKMPL